MRVWVVALLLGTLAFAACSGDDSDNEELLSQEDAAEIQEDALELSPVEREEIFIGAIRGDLSGELSAEQVAALDAMTDAQLVKVVETVCQDIEQYKSDSDGLAIHLEEYAAQVNAADGLDAAVARVFLIGAGVPAFCPEMTAVLNDAATLMEQ